MYARLPQRIWPKNYRAPADGVHKIEPTDLFVVSVGPGPDGDDLFWVNAVGESGRTMTGDICYTKAGITQFIETEYGITPQWEQV
jgi:hypothetical protein